MIWYQKQLSSPDSYLDMAIWFSKFASPFSRDLDDTLFGLAWIDLNDLYSKKRCSPWFSLHIGTKISSVGPIEAEIFNFFDLDIRIFSTTLEVTTSKEIHLNSFIGDSFQSWESTKSDAKSAVKTWVPGEKGRFCRLSALIQAWESRTLLAGGNRSSWWRLYALDGRGHTLPQNYLTPSNTVLVGLRRPFSILVANECFCGRVSVLGDLPSRQKSCD